MAAVVPAISTGINLERIATALNAVRVVLTALKVSQVKPFEYSKELTRETDQGTFQTVYTLDEKEISAENANTFLREEEVVCVKRCCCSLTGRFPSGVITVGTWLLAGTAARHEFVIIHTTEFVILIEIGLNGKEDSKTSIVIRSACTDDKKKQAEEQLLQKKWWVRTMKELKHFDLGRLHFYQIASLISLWILVNRAGGRKYTVIQKNCKSLARSILYFSKKSTNYWDVLYSLWGIFTDKPFNVCYHIDAILIEKAVVNGSYFAFDSVKELAQNTINLLEEIRTDKPSKIKLSVIN